VSPAGTTAVVWTARNGRSAEWHYARADDAERVAAQLRRGWRKDAHTETTREASS
jgi:hypothetical protein